MTKEEKFAKSLYDEANEQLKEVYKEQKQNRDELLQAIAMIILTYAVLDGLMSLKSKDKSKEYKRLSKLIKSVTQSQKGTQARVVNKILDNTVKNTLNFYSYNANLKDVRKITESNFKGKHFSKRVWENEKAVGEHLHKQVKQFLDGKINVNQIKKDIEKTFNTNAYNAKRLTETEVNRCSNNAFDRFCIETGVKKIRYNATLDGRTCPICAPDNDKVFDIDKKIELPRHPLCRCFYTIEDVFKTSGALSGALTSKNDPDFKRRDKHAGEYYESVRRRNSKEEILAIAKNTGLNPKTIEKVYNHVFINKYVLDQGYGNFSPDYDMAQSWQRLREGKNIQEHDLIMLKHERLEYELMCRYNKKYIEAHRLTEKKYNYARALMEYLKKNNLG
ncbi:minor capsid protein [Clostridium sp. FAM 1755]|uniref:minor capsid protein n=1 Tax=Clostridium TaxID=1485 RepID=UPI002901E0C5|nr:minor capsid protein [Clostridium botulinum]